MLPMNCPSCGKKGRVAPHLVRKPLTCRKCGAAFYLDHNGGVHPGDPDEAAGRKRRDAVAAAAAAATAAPPAEFDLNLGRWVKGASKRLRIGVIAACAAVVLLGLFALTSGPGGSGDLREQSLYFGELFIDDKVNRMMALAVPGTANEVAAWHAIMRPKLNHGGGRRGKNDVRSDTVILGDDGSRGLCILSLFVVRGASPASGTGDGPQNRLSLQLAWSKVDGRWRLDGASTLQAAGAAEGAAEAKTGAAAGQS